MSVDLASPITYKRSLEPRQLSIEGVITFTFT